MEEVRNMVKQFAFDGIYIDAIPYGDGHINHTFLVEFDDNGKRIRYILQKMNMGVASNPRLLIENMKHLTEYIQQCIIKNGEEGEKETLRLVPTISGDYSYCSESGEYYRAFHFIEHARSYDEAKSMEHVTECGRILGWFQRTLAGYSFNPEYVEMTKNFHNTVYRYQLFEEAVEKDVCGRVNEVQEEIAFYTQRRHQMNFLLALADEGKIPYRATHNDLRLSNIMIKEDTGKAAALVDLDTVMPGLAAYDYGDAIRSAAKHIFWEEGQIVKVELDLSIVEHFTKGYLEEAGGFLTDMEIRTLPEGIRLMSLELGMRYLTDYLNGDVYFIKNVNGENKVNARRELLFVTEIEKNLEQIQNMVNKYL